MSVEYVPDVCVCGHGGAVHTRGWDWCFANGCQCPFYRSKREAEKAEAKEGSE